MKNDASALRYMQQVNKTTFLESMSLKRLKLKDAWNVRSKDFKNLAKLIFVKLWTF